MDYNEGAMIDFINPWTGAIGYSHIWNSTGGWIESDYTSGAWISMVVSESVPEPACAGLVLLGGLLFLQSRRNRV